MVKNLCGFLLVFTTLSLISTPEVEEKIYFFNCCTPCQPCCSYYPPQEEIQRSCCFLLARYYETYTYKYRDKEQVTTDFKKWGCWPWFECNHWPFGMTKITNQMKQLES